MRPGRSLKGARIPLFSVARAATCSRTSRSNSVSRSPGNALLKFPYNSARVTSSTPGAFFSSVRPSWTPAARVGTTRAQEQSRSFSAADVSSRIVRWSARRSGTRTRRVTRGVITEFVGVRGDAADRPDHVRASSAPLPRQMTPRTPPACRSSRLRDAARLQRESRVWMPS